MRPWCRLGCAGLPVPDRRLRFALSGRGRSPLARPTRQSKAARAGTPPSLDRVAVVEELVVLVEAISAQICRQSSAQTHCPEKVGQHQQPNIRPCACFALRQLRAHFPGRCFVVRANLLHISWNGKAGGCRGAAGSGRLQVATNWQTEHGRCSCAQSH